MPSSFYNLVVINHVPRKKGVGSRESGRRYREIIVECASYARHLPKGERLRAYRECLKQRLKAIEAV
jgi:hypothetical protein